MWIRKEYVRTFGNAILMLVAFGLAFIVEFARVKFDINQIGDGAFWFNVTFTVLLQAIAIFSMTYESVERCRDYETYSLALGAYRKETDVLRDNGLISIFSKYCEDKTKKNREEAKRELLDVHGLTITDVENYRKRERKGFSRKEKKAIKKYLKNDVAYEIIYSSIILDDMEKKKQLNIEHSVSGSVSSKIVKRLINGIVLSVMLALVAAELGDGFTADNFFMFGMRAIIILYNAIAGWQLGQIVMLDERLKVFGSRVNFIHEFAEETDNLKYFNKDGGESAN